MNEVALGDVLHAMNVSHTKWPGLLWKRRDGCSAFCVKEAVQDVVSLYQKS